MRAHLEEYLEYYIYKEVIMLTGYNGVKVFAVTKARDRDELGETITRWLRMHPEYTIVDTVVRQSSDSEFHCLSITLFYNE